MREKFGRRVNPFNSRPQDALAAGVAVIYQEFNLVPWLSARENIFSQEPSIIGILPAKKSEASSRTLQAARS